MVVDIPKGSIEYVPIKVDDRLGSVTSLNALVVEQKIVSEDEATTVQDWTACDTDVMLVKPLIDTSVVGYVKGSMYRIYLKVSIAPEYPIMGPFGIRII